jgi:hypothetical protein
MITTEKFFYVQNWLVFCIIFSNLGWIYRAVWEILGGIISENGYLDELPTVYSTRQIKKNGIRYIGTWYIDRVFVCCTN